MLLGRPCAIVDLETTGSSRKHGRITEYAVLAWDENNQCSKHQQLLNPGCAIPKLSVN